MRSRTRTALTALLPLLAVAACAGPAAEEPGGSSPTSSPFPSPTPSQDPGAPQEQHLPEEPQPTITSGEPIQARTTA